MLLSHLHLGLPIRLFPLGFHAETLYAFFIFLKRAICLSHFNLLDLIILIIYDED
jgi:hypothetical protein